MGGDFTTACGNPISNIARWNGSAWSAVGSGVNGRVDALEVFNGELYVGGSFTQAGGSAANYIARWNGTAWSEVAGGMNGDVRALEVFNGELYAGGAFTLASGSAANYIAKLVTAAPIKLGSFTGRTDAHGVQLYWQTISNPEEGKLFHIDRSNDGKTFMPVGTVKTAASPQSVNSFDFIDETPFLGVNFYRLKILSANGNITFSHLIEIITQIPQQFQVLNLYPNPAKEAFTIIFQVPDECLTGLTLHIINPSGKKVRELNFGRTPAGYHKKEIDISGLEGGIYFVRLKAGDNEEVREIVIK